MKGRIKINRYTHPELRDSENQTYGSTVHRESLIQKLGEYEDNKQTPEEQAAMIHENIKLKRDIANYKPMVRIKSCPDKWFPIERILWDTQMVQVLEKSNVINTVDFSFVLEWREPKKMRVKPKSNMITELKKQVDEWPEWKKNAIGYMFDYTLKEEDTDEVAKICPKCGGTIAYDSYFKRFICRQCQG